MALKHIIYWKLCKPTRIALELSLITQCERSNKYMDLAFTLPHPSWPQASGVLNCWLWVTPSMYFSYIVMR